MMREENQTVRVGQRFPQGLSVPEFYGSGALIGQNIEYRTLACYIYSKIKKARIDPRNRTGLQRGDNHLNNPGQSGSYAHSVKK
jgi:hypothetical protein